MFSFSANSLERPKLLIIDENLAQRTLLREIASPAFDCKEADTAVAALRMLVTSRFDLILTDFDMAVVSSLELVKHLHEKSEGPPIVLLTSGDREALGRQPASFNVFDCLRKPFDAKGLSQTLQSAIRS